MGNYIEINFSPSKMWAASSYHYRDSRYPHYKYMLGIKLCNIHLFINIYVDPVSLVMVNICDKNTGIVPLQVQLQ